jgi:hypothetical protein
LYVSIVGCRPHPEFRQWKWNGKNVDIRVPILSMEASHIRLWEKQGGFKYRVIVIK